MLGLLREATGLIAFVRTVQAGSFSAAARSLGATPSSVSKGISRLERLWAYICSDDLPAF